MQNSICNFRIFNELLVQGKVVPSRAMKARRGIGGRVPVILSFGTRQRYVIQ
jgi:hypothetical protein